MSYAIQLLADSPFLIFLLPRDKFGQIASLNAMLAAGTVSLSAVVCGYLTDLFGYRVMFAWDFVVTIIATLALYGVYSQWQKLGGKENYLSPKIMEKM